MDSSNIYRFNGVDPFDNWTMNKDGVLRGYYPRNSLINLISQSKSGLKIASNGWTALVSASVNVIGRNCFRGNKRFKVIHVMPCVKAIDDYAFYSEIPLRVYLPDSIQHIKKNSFSRNVTLIVYKDSYSERFAIKQGLNYRYHEKESRNKSKSRPNKASK